MNRTYLFLLTLTVSLLAAACTPLVETENLQEPAPINGNEATIVADGESGTASKYPYEFVGISQWFNLGDVAESTLTREQLQGKVVLVDFWTYSCINCIRTLPYLTSWDEKYRESGLVIVGIHAPEFDFEKDPENVRAALERYGIKYPVGMDNDHITWDEYKNRYWPHSYLFDRNGNLVYDHIGEGRYDEVESRIQALLAVKTNMTEFDQPNFEKISTPEIYLGGVTSRGNTGYALDLGEHNFVLPETAKRNTVQLGGTWTVGDSFIESGQDATLQLLYHAKDVHIVAGGTGNINVKVNLRGVNTVDEVIAVSAEQLYTLASTDYKDQTITIQVSPGVRLYSFTFG